MQLTKSNSIILIIHALNLLCVILAFTNSKFLPYIPSFYTFIFVYLIGDYFKARNRKYFFRNALMYSLISLISALIIINIVYS